MVKRILEGLKLALEVVKLVIELLR